MIGTSRGGPLIHAHPTQNEALGEAHLTLADRPDSAVAARIVNGVDSTLATRHDSVRGRYRVRAAKKVARIQLSRDLILEAALGIVNSDQVRELTMSRLGQALGADPSAVYRHFRNKDELLLAMADRMLEEVAAAFQRSDDPIENLRRTTWALRDGYLRRPGLAQEVAARFTGGAAEAQLVREMLESIEVLGFTRSQAIPVARGLAEMTLGHIVMTADVLSLSASQQAFDLRVATTYYSAPYHPATVLPPAEQLAATRADSDGVFATMLETYLAGLVTQVPPPRVPRRRRPATRSTPGA